MPTYAYRCRDCGHELEVHQGFADASLTECPVCGGALRKQYGTVGVTFNGSGFYRTDSRAAEAGRAQKSDAGAPEPAKSGASASSGSSGDAKTAPAAASPAPAAPAAKPAASAPSGG